MKIVTKQNINYLKLKNLNIEKKEKHKIRKKLRILGVF